MCEFIDNKILKYQEDSDTLNTIHFDNLIYIRENKELIFKIDFNKKEFRYTLKENNYEIKDKLTDCLLERNKEEIKLRYQIDEEIKEILIKIL